MELRFDEFITVFGLYPSLDEMFRRAKEEELLHVMPLDTQDGRTESFTVQHLTFTCEYQRSRVDPSFEKITLYLFPWSLISYTATFREERFITWSRPLMPRRSPSVHEAWLLRSILMMIKNILLTNQEMAYQI